MPAILTYCFLVCVGAIVCLAEALPVSAASLQCPRYSTVLEGTTINMGVVYTERLGVSKVGAGSGYAGRWKVDFFEQIITYPHALGVSVATNDRHELGYGIYMVVGCTAAGATIHCRTTESNMMLESAGGRVRMERTAPWHGRIEGNTMFWKFDRGSPAEPELRGVIAEGSQEPVTLTILEPAPNQKYAFTANTVGALEMKLRAKVVPERYANDIVWSIPDIPGQGRRTTNPDLRGSEVEVIYDGLPESNESFGRKKVTATLTVGACRAEESREVRVFYPREATNNPQGRFPNWFYYWRQTPAARPGGAQITILYGGRFFEYCPDAITGAIFSYRTIQLNTIHVCDLAKFGPEFPVVYPILRRANPGRKFFGYQTSTHIDTFAAAVIHEQVHMNVYQQWKSGKSAEELLSPLFDYDQDGLPNFAEAGLGFDPAKVRTYLPNFVAVENDEEWLAYETQSAYKNGTHDAHDWARPGKNWPLNQP